MPQAGIHCLAGMVVRKWAPNREWLMLGIVLGNPLPDADNFAVAVATLAKLSPEGLHRTFTHSLLFVVAIFATFSIVAKVTKSFRWSNLGLGLAIGVLMHILLDLIAWFKGLEILWPIPSWINLWSNFTVPEWWSKLMLSTEFLFFGLFFVLLSVIARKQDTNVGFLPTLRIFIAIQGLLFLVFTILVYTLKNGFMIPFGILYLLSLGHTFSVIIRMRETIETVAH